MKIRMNQLKNYQYNNSNNKNNKKMKEIKISKT